MAGNNIVVRADTCLALSTGVGHVVRAFNLAEYLKRDLGGSVTWIGTEETQKFMGQSGRLEIVDVFHVVPQCRDDFQNVAFEGLIIPDFGADKPIFIQDDMILDYRTLSLAREKGIVGQSVVINEIISPEVRLGDPDILVNVLPCKRDVYTNEMISPKTKCLLGPQYQLLDPEIRIQFKERLEYREQQEQAKEINILLVNGGTNVAGLLNHLVCLISDNYKEFKPNVRFHVNTGHNANYIGSLKQYVMDAKSKGLDINLILGELPKYANMDIYIGASGTSVFESCAVGGLANILIGAGTGQPHLGQALQNVDGAIYVGEFWSHDRSVNDVDSSVLKGIVDLAVQLIHDKNRRIKMTQNAYEFCDGRGVERVTKELQKSRRVNL